MTSEGLLDEGADGSIGRTPSQTIGPFFHYALPWKGGADLVGQSTLGARPDLFPASHYLLALPRSRGVPSGQVIEIGGQVIDGVGSPVSDAMLEIWQANSAGRYAGPNDDQTDRPLDPCFLGFGRSATAVDGRYRFRTILPGRVPGPGNSLQAPHVAMSVFARGLMRRLATRIYFDGQDGNDTDPVLSIVPESRRATLIARPDGHSLWRFDIVLQGSNETVFFDL